MRARQKGSKKRQPNNGAPIPEKLRRGKGGRKLAGLRRPKWMLTK